MLKYAFSFNAHLVNKKIAMALVLTGASNKAIVCDAFVRQLNYPVMHWPKKRKRAANDCGLLWSTLVSL